MNITNAAYRSIPIRWNAVTLPLKAGTPIGLNGLPCNDENAVGLVTQTITVTPVLPTIRVLVAGDVSLAEVEAGFGEALTEAALSAMSGIRFFGEDGVPVPDYVRPGTVPAATGKTFGGVLLATPVAGVPTGENADADLNARAINATLSALITAGIMAPSAPITITKQPPKDSYIDLGDPVAIQIIATGEGSENFKYQWYIKNASASYFSKSSEKDDTYNLSPFKASNDGRQIYCEITNANGDVARTEIGTLHLNA